MQIKNLILLIFAGAVTGSGWICVATMVKYTSAVLVTGHRFLISGIVLLLSIIFIKKLPKYSIKIHFILLLQGGLSYSLYCGLNAYASKFIVSGLVAVIATLMFVSNTCFECIIFQKKVKKNAIFGGILAVSGVLLLVKDDILNTAYDLDKLIGLISAFVATLAFSLGSIISKYVTTNKGVCVIYSTIFSMIYSAFVCIIMELVSGGNILPKEIFNQEYIMVIIVMGGIIAPICYISYNYLIKHVGVSEASFIFIISPVVAIIISSLTEGLTLDFITIIATILTIMGTVITIIDPFSIILKVLQKNTSNKLK